MADEPTDAVLRDSVEPPDPAVLRTTRRLIVASGLVMLAALVLRGAAARGDLGLDEIWSWNLAARCRSPMDALRIRHDNNNPLNTLYLYCVGPDAGSYAYRLFSLFSGAGTLVLAVATAARFGPIAALTTAILLGSSYPLVHLSAEARGYAPAAFFALLSFVLAERALAGARIRLAWIASVAFVLGFASHLSFVEYYVAAAVWSFFRCRRAPNIRDKAAYLAALHALPLATILWLCISILPGLATGGAQTRPLAQVLFNSLTLSFGMPPNAFGGVGASLFALAALCYVFGRLRRQQPDLALLLLLVIVISPAITIVLARPEYVFVRHLLIPMMLLGLLFALALAEWIARQGLRRWLAVAALTAATLGNLHHTSQFFRRGRMNYSGAVAYLLSHSARAPITIASDHDFRNPLLLRFFVHGQPGADRLVYFNQDQVPPEGTEWFIAHRLVRQYVPGPEFTDGHGHRYALAAHYSSWCAFGAWQWMLYHRAGDSPPATATASPSPG